MKADVFVEIQRGYNLRIEMLPNETTEQLEARVRQMDAYDLAEQGVLQMVDITAVEVTSTTDGE